MKTILAVVILLFSAGVLFAADVSVPSVNNQQTVTACLGCHDADAVPQQFRGIPSEWRKSWHGAQGISCNDCHGGDPNDPAMAMSPERGFVGVPSYTKVPEFCGKCHVGILKNYLDSGHGKALVASGSGPNCVVCHGSHSVQKANVDIINEKRCTQCHTYERAHLMKQALQDTENKMTSIEAAIMQLKKRGVFTEEEDKELFRIQAEYRTLFHTVDVSLVKQKTDSFSVGLAAINSRVNEIFKELNKRRSYSAFLLALFSFIALALFLFSKMKS